MEDYVTISADPAAFLTEFDDNLGNEVNNAMRSNAYFLAEVMKGLTPVRTGETRDSIGVDEAWLEYDVGSDSPVFGWLDAGTEGHGPIIPVNASALHWFDESGEHFARYITYVTGIEAHNIIDTALDMSGDVMDANLALYIDAAWDESGGGGAE